MFVRWKVFFSIVRSRCVNVHSLFVFIFDVFFRSHVTWAAFPTDTDLWTLHDSNIRVVKPLCSCGRIDSNSAGLNRATLDSTHLRTFNGHLALYTFIFFPLVFYKWCFRFYWRTLLNLYMCAIVSDGHNSHVFHICHVVVLVTGEKWPRAWLRGPVWTLSCHLVFVQAIRLFLALLFVFVASVKSTALVDLNITFIIVIVWKY